MLSKLPFELVQTIAEYAAPSVANDRQCLYLARRRFFLSLATLSRSTHLALRALVWQHIWIFQRNVHSFIRAVWFNADCAALVNDVTCTGIDARAFSHLASMWAKLCNVYRVRLLGPIVGIREYEAFSLEALERFPREQAALHSGCRRPA